MAVLRRSVVITFKSILITMTFFFIGGIIINGLSNIEEVIYFFVIGGGMYFVPFLFVTFCYIKLVKTFSKRFEKLEDKRNRIMWSLVAHFVILIVLFIINLIVSSFSFNEALNHFAEFGLYGVFFIVMVLVNEYSRGLPYAKAKM